ncbi:MAG: hypothetical protein WC492_03695 [Candidatus Micrarchaeia archaeon]|jgi:hypothetical protein
MARKNSNFEQSSNQGEITFSTNSLPYLEAKTLGFEPQAAQKTADPKSYWTEKEWGAYSATLYKKTMASLRLGTQTPRMVYSSWLIAVMLASMGWIYALFVSYHLIFYIGNAAYGTLSLFVLLVYSALLLMLAFPRKRNI